jgi:hypothetical protein
VTVTSPCRGLPVTVCSGSSGLRRQALAVVFRQERGDHGGVVASAQSVFSGSSAPALCRSLPFMLSMWAATSECCDLAP